MRAATLDQRIAGVSYGWEGERNNSQSVQRVSGTVVRRNLASLWGIVGGTGLVVVNDTAVDSRFFSLARRATITTPPTGGTSWWTNVALPTVSVGDVYVYQVRVSSDLTVVNVNLGGGNAPEYTRTMISDVDHGDGTRTLAYKLTINKASTNMTPNIILLLNLVNVAAGTVFLAGECCIEKTSVVGDFFDGDTAVNAATINGVAL